MVISVQRVMALVATRSTDPVFQVGRSLRCIVCAHPIPPFQTNRSVTPTTAADCSLWQTGVPTPILHKYVPPRGCVFDPSLIRVLLHLVLHHYRSLYMVRSALCNFWRVCRRNGCSEEDSKLRQRRHSPAPKCSLQDCQLRSPT